MGREKVSQEVTKTSLVLLVMRAHIWDEYIVKCTVDKLYLVFDATLGYDGLYSVSNKNIYIDRLQ